MILTITAHAALDRVIFIPEFHPTTRMQAAQSVDYVGGKGFNVSVALAGLGVTSLAMGILAGENGRRIEFLLRGYGIPCNLTWVEGETRIAHVVVETTYHRYSYIMTPSYFVSLEDLQVFLSRYRSRVWEADWVVASGSLAEGIPANFYAEVVEIARQAGAQTLVDGEGEPALEALAAHPDIVKQNVTQFCSTFKINPEEVESQAGLIKSICRVQETSGMSALVISRAELGIFAATQGSAYVVTYPVQPTINPAGADDCMSAALVWRLGLGESWPEALRWAASSGAAGMLTEGTGD